MCQKYYGLSHETPHLIPNQKFHYSPTIQQSDTKRYPQINPKWFFPSRLYTFLVSPVSAKCPAHFILLT